MKILHILSHPAAGGAETYVRDLAIGMSKVGHTVCVAFLDKARDFGRSEEFEKTYLKELADNKVNYVFIGTKARRNFLYGIYRGLRISKEFNPDIVHSHLYYGLLFFTFTKAKVVYTHHNILLGAPKFLLRVLSLRVAAYVGICNACESLLKEVVPQKTTQIANAISDTRLIAQTRTSRSNCPVIFMAGSMTAQKNYHLFLDAVALLPNLQFSVRIAGEGDLLEGLRDYSESLGLASRVEFLGVIGNVFEEMAAADIFAMSSSWEGLPISLIEATLAGLPVIVTNVGGCEEVVHRCTNGVIVDELSPEAYAQGLEMLLSDSILRSRFTENALSYSGYYTIPRALKEHMTLYKQMLGRP